MSIFDEAIELTLPKKQTYEGRREDFINDFYEIDPTSKTGLRWTQDRVMMKKGDEAGSYNRGTGYWQLSDGYYGRMGAHQAVMFLATGKMSNIECQVDHINGNPLDNKVENLRFVTPTGNQRNANRKTNVNNTSGIPGIQKVSIGGKTRWRAKYAGAILYTGLCKETAIKSLEEAKEKDVEYINA